MMEKKKRIATIDIGTNSILCLIADVDMRGDFQVIFDEAMVVRLGQGVDKSRKFHPEALKRAEEALKKFRIEIDQRAVEEIRAVATSASRDVSNGDELMRIGSCLNIPIKIIDGNEEAKLTLKGVLAGKIAKPPFVIIDIGGGSTEFILCNDLKKNQLLSLDIGSVRLTENWITSHPVSDEEMTHLEAFIESFLKKHSEKIDVRAGIEMVAVAGTVTALASAIRRAPYQRDQVEGFQMETKMLKTIVDELRNRNLEEREKEFFLESKRADVIVAGGALLLKILNFYHADRCKVSTLGARYGLLF